MSTDQQQFCLRWHSYQSSLMATLPQLLDGNHLTDVTLSAQGRNLRAHKVILSACSHYFKELFKWVTQLCLFQELQPLQHPVIVLPGMNFSDLVALVTFMYSGEVNIYEHQLSGLLTMADVLHIRGLSEVGSETGNAGMDSLTPPTGSAKRDQKSPNAAKRAKLSTSSPTHVTSPPLDREQSADKRSKESALDYALYGKRTWAQALDPNLYTNGTITQEVAENLATLDSKPNASQFQTLNEKMTDLYNQKIGSKKSSAERRNFLDEQVFSAGSQKSGNPLGGLHVAADGFLRVKTEQELLGSAAVVDVSKFGSGNGKHSMEKDSDDRKGLELSPSRLFTENMVIEDKVDLSPTQGLDLSQAVGSNSSSSNSTSNNSPSSKCANAFSTSGTTPTGHTKLYATCFVCGKQLSNQYNLRVHMETHQNVQYGCSICSHVSRSKDALRKHVSYRHPAPVDGTGIGGGASGGGNKREGKKKADQTTAAASVNASSTSVVGTSTTSTVTTLANSTTASSSVTTTSTNPVSSSDSALQFIPNTNLKTEN